MSPTIKHWCNLASVAIPSLIAMIAVSWFLGTNAQEEARDRRQRATQACFNVCARVRAEMVTISFDGQWRCSCFNPRTEGVSSFVIENREN